MDFNVKEQKDAVLSVDLVMNIRCLLLTACAVGVVALPSYSAIIFDNADAPLSITTRTAGLEGAAAYLQIGGSNVTIAQIAINAQPLQNGQLKFVIFSDIVSPGSDSGTLLFSDTVNVNSASSLTYILSDPFSFTLQAGRFYDIGAVFSGASIRYTYDLTGDSVNGITSIVSNENVDNFGTPVLVGHGASDINIQLFSAAAVIPEPSTYVLGMLGIAGLGLVRYRQRSIVVKS